VGDQVEFETQPHVTPVVDADGIIRFPVVGT